LILILIKLILISCISEEINPVPDASALSRRSGLILSFSTVEGREILSAIDTGCDVCLIDEMFFDTSEEKASQSVNTPVILADGRKLDGSVTPIQLQLKSHQPEIAYAVFMDTKPLASATGVPVQAFIGMNILSRTPFGLRAPLKYIQYTDKELPPVDRALMLNSNMERLRTNVTLPGLGAQDAALDTGMLSTMRVTAGQMKRSISLGHAQACPALNRQTMAADGGIRDVEFYWLRSITIGETSFQNIPVCVGPHLTIGMGLIRHLNLTVDAKSRRIWIEPGPTAQTASFAPGATGYFFRFDGDGKLMVLPNMRPGGPGELAGIQPGDEIITIDGKPAADFTIYEVTDRFSQAGTSLTLTCKRDGKLFDSKLELKHRIAYPPKWSEQKDAGDDSSFGIDTEERHQR